jgi:hypothetical protein
MLSHDLDVLATFAQWVGYQDASANLLQHS